MINEFDLLSAAINAAIKHAKHNQKSHGRRGAQYEQTAMLLEENPLPPARSLDDYARAGDVQTIPYFIVEPNPYMTVSAHSEYINPKSDDAAEERYNRLGERMIVEPAKDERRAAELYQGKYYRSINSHLNNRTPLEELNKEAQEIIQGSIKRIDNLLNRSKTPEDVVVFRGLDVKPAKLAELTTVGNIIRRPGYLSTSTSINTAAGFAKASGNRRYDEETNRVVLHIFVPAGSRALHMKRATGGDPYTERELLLPRGSSMIVRQVKKQSFAHQDGTTQEVSHVFVEILPEDAA